MPATHCFQLANVDEDAWNTVNLHGANPQSPLYAILQSGRYPLIPDSHCCASKIGPGVIGFNAGHIWDYDNTAAPQLTNNLVTAQIQRLVNCRADVAIGCLVVNDCRCGRRMPRSVSLCGCRSRWPVAGSRSPVTSPPPSPRSTVFAASFGSR